MLQALCVGVLRFAVMSFVLSKLLEGMSQQLGRLSQTEKEGLARDPSSSSRAEILRRLSGGGEQAGAAACTAARGVDAVPSAGAGGGHRSLAYAMERARALGLRITSTTGGKHAPNSYHYKGRAIDVAGSPAAMRQFFNEMALLSPTELFYDPLGGIKHGRRIGAIGGHRNHVHFAV